DCGVGAIHKDCGVGAIHKETHSSPPKENNGFAVLRVRWAREVRPRE
ncbi:hypothetical protein CCACVL1_25375, partial [Corchorus capsularis]